MRDSTGDESEFFVSSFVMFVARVVMLIVSPDYKHSTRLENEHRNNTYKTSGSMLHLALYRGGSRNFKRPG